MAQNKLPKPITELLDLAARNLTGIQQNIGTLEVIYEAANVAGAGKESPKATLALG